jgi:integrase
MTAHSSRKTILWRTKRMRSRHQNGWLELSGKRLKRWYGHYTLYERDAEGKEKRRHIRIELGEKGKLCKWKAEEKLRQEIGKVTKGAPKADGQTLAWFTRERFLEMRAPKWAPSTRETNLYHIESIILPELGENRLSELDKYGCQVFINKLAKDKLDGRGNVVRKAFSFTVVDHCRTMLKAILEEAVEAELIGKNPARKLENPEMDEPEKEVLPKSQARQLIEALEFRDRLLVMIGAFCAMRPGEIFGLRWSSWRGDHFQIEGTAWRGVLRPGKAKTRNSKAPVTIPNALIPALQLWREQNAGAPADTLIFPSGNGTPMRPENWLRRRAKPLADKLGITVPVNFQVLRRTFATNAQGHGNPKDVQAHLRHSDIGTTLNEYTQSIPDSVRTLVNRVADDVMGAPLTERVQ